MPANSNVFVTGGDGLSPLLGIYLTSEVVRSVLATKSCS